VACSEADVVSKLKKRGRPRKDVSSGQKKIEEIKEKAKEPSQNASSTLDSTDEKNINDDVSPKKRGRPPKDKPRKDVSYGQKKIEEIKEKTKEPSQNSSSTLDSTDEKNINDDVSPKKRGRPPKDKPEVDAASKKRGRPPTKKAKAASGEEVATSHSLDPSSPIPLSIEKKKKKKIATKSQRESSTKTKAVKRATKKVQEVSPSKRGRPKKEATQKVEPISKRGKKVPATSKGKSSVKPAKKT
jgi:hypothetical protein